MMDAKLLAIVILAGLCLAALPAATVRDFYTEDFNYEWEAFTSLDRALEDAFRAKGQPLSEEESLEALKKPWILKLFEKKYSPLAAWRRLKAAASGQTKSDEGPCDRDTLDAFHHANRGLGLDLAREQPVSLVAHFLKPHMRRIADECSENIDYRLEQVYKYRAWPQSVEQLLDELISEQVVKSHFEHHPNEGPIQLGLLEGYHPDYGLTAAYWPRRSKDEVLENLIQLVGVDNVNMVEEDVALAQFHRHITKPCNIYRSKFNAIILDSIGLAQYSRTNLEGFLQGRSQLLRETLLRDQICASLIESRSESINYVRTRIRSNILAKSSSN